MKLYADEPGADAVRGLPLAIVSTLARVEVPSALWRKHRIGELSREDAAVLVQAFEQDWFGTEAEPVLLRIGVTDEILDEAARCAARHPLRAYDAVQLASAIAARRAEPSATGFACFDEQLTAAAAAEGFTSPD